MNNKEFVIGKLKEDDFAKLFNDSIASTKDEDMYLHWDLKIEAKIDVKSLKKQSREDVFYCENFHWVETKNVKGDKGWLYGEADFFAFETEDFWLITDREILQKFIEAKTINKTVGSSKDPYELYRRTGRKDTVIKVKTLDLFYISTQIIKKNEINN